MSRWLVGIKRLVQEVQYVEAPLSPSSDCHSDVKLTSLCEVLPSPVPANCPSLISADCQSTGAAVTSLDVSGNSDAGTVTMQATLISNNSSADVSSSSALVTSQVDIEHAVTSVDGYDFGSPSFTSRQNIEGSDTDQKPVSSPTDTALSSLDVLSASETQMLCDSTVTSVTSADS